MIDCYDYEVLMPKWELRDFFGRGAIRKARWEYVNMRKRAEALQNEIDALYKEREKAVNLLADALSHEQAVTAELNRRLAVCDEARKNLGEKINSLVTERDALQKDLNYQRECYKSLAMNYSELEIAHEKLVRSMPDKAAEVADG